MNIKAFLTDIYEYELRRYRNINIYTSCGLIQAHSLNEFFEKVSLNVLEHGECIYDQNELLKILDEGYENFN